MNVEPEVTPQVKPKKKEEIKGIQNKRSPKNKADFEALMEMYKVNNPVKFAQKEESGEWKRKLAKFG